MAIWIPEKKRQQDNSTKKRHQFVTDPEKKEEVHRAIQVLVSTLDPGCSLVNHERDKELLQLVLYVSNRMIGEADYEYLT